MSHVNVDWYITSEGRPVITVRDPWGRPCEINFTPTFARILADDLVKAADKAERAEYVAKRLREERAS